MGFDKQAGISVLELCLYIPSLIASAVVCKRHGFNRSSGWIFTLILCLVRIIGACCQLATLSSSSKGLIETVLILESVGLSPLLLATLGLLARCADSIVPTGSKATFSAIHFHIVRMTITIGLILSIAGGTSSITPDGKYQPQSTSKAGVVLYLLALVALILIALITATKLSNGPVADTRLAWVTILAIPFIFIRLLYSFLTVFGTNKHFNPATGSVIVHVFMGILEEFVVVLMYLIIGWKTEALAPGAKGPIASRPWKMKLGGQGATGGRGRGPSGRRQGPIHALVNAGIERVQQRQGGRDVEQTDGPRQQTV